MAGWTEILVTPQGVKETGRGPHPGFGVGMGGGWVILNDYPLQVEYYNSSLSLTHAFPLQIGRMYRVTRYSVKRIAAPSEEHDPAKRLIRELGCSPACIRRHQPGEMSSFEAGRREVYNGRDMVYSLTLRVQATFPLEWGEEVITRTEGKYRVQRDAVHTWKDGEAAITNDGSTPYLQVCGAVPYAELRRIAIEAGFAHRLG